VSLRIVATAPCEEAQAVFEPRQDLFDRKGSYACSRELDRQRQPLDALADLHNDL
jgi:hypothetical protein